MYAWKEYSASITVTPPPWPDTVTTPHDRRHRWTVTSRRHKANGWPSRTWFRCTACGRRRSVTYLVALLGDKVEKARQSMAELLAESMAAGGGGG